MTHRHLLLAIALSSAMIVGCKKRESTAPQTAPPPQQTAPSEQKTETPPPAPQAAPAGQTESPQPAPQPMETTTPPATTPSAMSSSNVAEAQSKINEAMQYIRENKFDLADKTLNQVEGMRSSLPASMQTQLDNARKMLNTAKSAQQYRMPSGGGTNLPSDSSQNK